MLLTRRGWALLIAAGEAMLERVSLYACDRFNEAAADRGGEVAVAA